MKIRSKFILNYSILSFILLLVFSVIVVFSYIKYRQHDIKVRLHNRAVSTANLLLNDRKIDSSMVHLIDKNIITAMGDLQIAIFDQHKKLIYSNSNLSIQTELQLINSPIHTIFESFTIGHNTVSFTYIKFGKTFIVKASAYDYNGQNELKALLYIVSLVLVFCIFVIICFGFYNAIWSLKPFKKIIKEVSELDPAVMNKRISVQGNDELSQLAKTFNILLNLIEQTFETEKSFISNASHELRTPITSVLGQIEVILNQSRTNEEYKKLLQSVYADTLQMANIINGFLDLAEANLDVDQIVMETVHIDDVIYSIVDDFDKRKPNYYISVDFNTNHEIEAQFDYVANESLLRLMFSNLIDNACKYSDDKKARVNIDFTSTEIIVSIADHGIGIPKEDYEKIFKPLFRSSNTSGKPGHGIGLAIVKRIADIHKVTIDITSQLNLGTSVYVHFKL